MVTTTMGQCLHSIRENSDAYNTQLHSKYKAYVEYMCGSIAAQGCLRVSLGVHTKQYGMEHGTKDPEIDPCYVSFSDFPECTDQPF